MQPDGGRIRLAYLDAARGLALVLMIVNHTARYWLGDAVDRWPLIYLTTAGAGPMFFFLVGFVLARSYRTTADPVRRAVERAAGLFAAGYIVNVVLWPQQPLLGSNVLHTIGVAVLVALLARPWLRAPLGRYAVAAAGVGLYASFVLLFDRITAWVAAHPMVGELAFYDFPPWPWVGLVLLGLALGAAAAELPDQRAAVTFHARLGAAALALALAAVACEWWWPRAPRLAFATDLLITNHWLPGGPTVAWVVAWVFGTLAACFYLVERRGLALGPLVVYGRTALFLYVAHHIVVVTLVQRALGLSLRSWLVWALATAALLVALLGLARLWRALRRAARAEAPAHARLVY